MTVLREGDDLVLIFDRLVLDVAQLDRAIAFYTQALDFEIVTTADWLGQDRKSTRLNSSH